MYWHLVRVAHIEAIRMNEELETLEWLRVFQHMAWYFIVFEGNFKTPSKLVHKKFCTKRVDSLSANSVFLSSFLWKILKVTLSGSIILFSKIHPGSLKLQVSPHGWKMSVLLIVTFFSFFLNLCIYCYVSVCTWLKRPGVSFKKQNEYSHSLDCSDNVF